MRIVSYSMLLTSRVYLALGFICLRFWRAEPRSLFPCTLFVFLLIVSPETPPIFAQTSGTAEHKNVLVLYDEQDKLPGLAVLDQSLRSTFNSAPAFKIDVYSESLDRSRFQEEGYGQFLGEFLRQKYSRKRIDVIVAAMGPSLDFMLERAEKLFPGTPIVFCGVDRRELESRTLNQNVTGVLVKRDFKGTLDVALRLHPDTLQVVFIAGVSDFDKRLAEQAIGELRQYEDRVAIKYLTNSTLDHVLAEVSQLPPNTIILASTMFSDGAGQAFVPHDVVSLISQKANAPVYGFLDQFLGRGIVGGHLYTVEEHGKKAAELALRILEGQSAADLPVVEGDASLDMFDWRQLQRWGISEANLPAGSIVQFKQPTVWEEYKWYAIGLITAVIVETLLIAWLLYLRYRRRQAETEAARLSSRLQLAHQAARMGTFEWNIQTGTNIWSPELETMYGLSPGTFAQTQSAWEDLVHPEDRDRAQLLVQHALETGEPAEGEWRVLWPDDSFHWIFGRFQAFMDDAGKPSRLSGINIDITDRKAAEEALRESESFNRTVLSSLNTHVCVLDRYGRIISVNHSWAAFARDNGLASEASVGPGVNYLDVCRRAVTDGNELARLALDGVRAVCDGTQEYFGLEYPCHSPTEKRWFLMIVTPLQGRNGGAVVVHNDITDSKLAAEAVRESEERFRNMAETAPVMIWITDENQATTYVNKKWLQFTGSALELELGHAWTKHLHPDDLGPTVERGNAAFEKRVPFELEFRLRRADGDYRWVISSGAPRFSSEGDFLGYIGTSIDITERKQSEDALKQAHDELKELKNQLEAENIYLQEELRQDQAFGDIVGESSAIKYVHFKVSQVAPTDSTVLITGETGTGKELVAHAIHDASQRKDRPLIKVNCAALSPSLIESELFGHERGAFTGAAARKLGRFELANTGTLLLDEIGELPLELQSKLLRVLQEGEFERVGGGKTIKADVRIIASTNRDLKQAVEKGKFREDLWYRLNVFPITTPPLRDRRDDIPILTEHFARIFAKKFGKELTAISPQTLSALCTYSWPGNVRELANVIERAIINLRGSVLKIQEDFPMRDADRLAASVKTLEDMERDHICQVLEDLNWRIDGPKGAARVLGINPSTLRTRMGKLGINKPNGRPRPTSSDR